MIRKCGSTHSQDMTVYVKKVQFKLHDSYPSPVRGGCGLKHLEMKGHLRFYLTQIH